MLRARTPVKAMRFGGDRSTALVWWNFVSSSTERIEQARQDWLEGSFGNTDGDPEFTPLPER